MIKIGLLSFSDGRERVHQGLVEIIDRVALEMRNTLEKTGEVEIVPGECIIHSAEEAKDEARRLAAAGVEGTIFNIPVFAFPNFPVIAAENGRGPFLCYSPVMGTLPGLGGLLASAGSIRQVGLRCEKVYGSLSDKAIIRRLLIFSRAASAVNRLRGSVFGLIGGRSIGMLTGSHDDALWHHQFGVDTEHIDQLEIIRLAGEVPLEEVARALRWLKDRLDLIAFDEKKLTEKTLEFQIRCYLATRKIIRDHGLHFVAVKCHYELSEYYVTQCLGVTFFNDPYDWDGPKKPFVYACEADADGALTMQILKLISEKPVLFFDVRHYDQKEGVFVFCNCGGMASWYADRSDDPGKNLKEVRLYPTIPKYAGGGAHVQFVCKKGPVTLARLTRTLDRYRMVIGRAEFQSHPREKLHETVWEWPHAFAHLAIPPEHLVDRLDSNHLHAVDGDYVEELLKICDLLDIESVMMV
jgi:L-fucose/D-arabinose isomerase